LANGRFQLQATTRVPDDFIPVPGPWPKYPVLIRLKNLGDSDIQYSYLEDGIRKDGIIRNGFLSEKATEFSANTVYLFNFKTEGTTRSTT
jgi:hypothetical protein